MGAVCTSKANRQSNDGENRPTKRNTVCIHSSARVESDDNDDDNDDADDALFNRISNADDDPNFIILNHSRISANSADDLCLLDPNKSRTSLSSMLSPARQLSDIIHTPKDNPLDYLCTDLHDIYIPPDQTITIGDQIELIPKYNSLHGIIRFIGEIVGKDGVFYGIELHNQRDSDDVCYFRKLCNQNNGFNVNQNNGYVNNKCYFKTDQYESLFVRKAQITRILKVNYDNPRVGIHQDVYVPKYQCKGTVQYIGIPQCESNDNIHLIHYGIQLDNFYYLCMQDRLQMQDHRLFVDSTALSHYLVPSRCNLLIHGYLDSECINIPSGIIKLIGGYTHMMEIRLTSLLRSIGDWVCAKYEPFDINNDICGAAITVKYSGYNTHNTDAETVIAGYYQFCKTSKWDAGDYMTPWVNKTEFQIIQFKNGDERRIYRTIDCDNEIPLMKDDKSIRTRFRHDIHASDVDECDHNVILEHIAQLYGIPAHDIKSEFDKYGIQLHGLRY